MQTAYFDLVDTPFDSMLVAGHGRALVAIKFHTTEKDIPVVLEEFARETQGAFTLERDGRKIAPLIKQVRDYLNGKRTDFDLEMDLSWVKGFRRKVLEECTRIPRGEVRTYAELAARAGSPRAFRAVGNTMRTNPIPIVIPCHRVIGSNGSLTGFGGGLDMKARLLELENAKLPGHLFPYVLGAAGKSKVDAPAGALAGARA